MPGCGNLFLRFRKRPLGSLHRSAQPDVLERAPDLFRCQLDGTVRLTNAAVAPFRPADQNISVTARVRTKGGRLLCDDPMLGEPFAKTRQREPVGALTLVEWG